MANIFEKPDIVANEALALLMSNMVATKLYSRRYESDLNSTSKVGDTIRLRRRGAGVVDEYNGSTVTVRDINETKINLTLEKHYDATIKVTAKEQTLDIKDFSSQVLAPRMVEMAEQIDTYALSKVKDIPNVIDNVNNAGASIGALPNDLAGYAKIDRVMNDLKIPARDRFMLTSTELREVMLSIDSFVEADKSGADNALRSAEIGPIMGLRSFMGQNFPTTTHTTGTGFDGAVNGAVAAGATSFAFDGMTTAAGTLLAGDIVEIAGYGNVTVAANVTASSGAGTITVVEPFRAAVADNATFTVTDNATGDVSNTWESHGAAFHPDCLAFVAVPLDLPRSAAAADYAQDPGNNVAVRMVFDYDRDLKADVLSIDCLVGSAMIDGRLGVQVCKSTS